MRSHNQDSYITYYSHRDKNPWEIPCNQYESVVLNKAMCVIAMGLHSITPSAVKGKYPPDLRFFTNPLKLFITWIFISIICYFLF
jgi:hypothetical protein